jgi:hypothetical protein
MDRVAETRATRHAQLLAFRAAELATEAARPRVPGGMVTLPPPPPPPAPSTAGFTVADFIEGLLPLNSDPTRFEPRDKLPTREPTMRELKALPKQRPPRLDAGNVQSVDSFGRIIKVQCGSLNTGWRTGWFTIVASPATKWRLSRTMKLNIIPVLESGNSFAHSLRTVSQYLASQCSTPL